MQNTTVQLPSSHPVKALTGLARQIALPSEYAPTRFPSFPALERTAVIGFNQPADLYLEANVNTRLMLTRQPTFPAWADQVRTGESYYSAYQSNRLGSDFTDGTVAIFDQIAELGSERTGGIFPDISSYAAATERPIGCDNSLHSPNSPFMYIPSSYKTFVVIGNQGAMPAGNYNVWWEKWESPGETSQFSTLLTITAGNSGGGASVVVSGNSWIRPLRITMNITPGTGPSFIGLTLITAAGNVTYIPSTSTPGSIASAITATKAFLPLVAPAEYANSEIPWRSTRLTAVALLATNVSQVLNKSGTILCGRLSPATSDVFNAVAADLQNLHPAEKAWLPLESGMYTYCPPSTDMVMFYDYSKDWGIESAPIYRLDNDAMVNVASIRPTAAEQLAVTVSWHQEFRTSSALFQLALSGITLETLHQAQLVLATAGFFFDNWHHEFILSALTSAAGKVVPHLLPAARTVLNRMVRKGPRKPNNRPRRGQSKSVRVNTKMNHMKATNLNTLGGNDKNWRKDYQPKVNPNRKPGKGGLDKYLATR